MFNKIIQVKGLMVIAFIKIWGKTNYAIHGYKKKLLPEKLRNKNSF